MSSEVVEVVFSENDTEKAFRWNPLENNKYFICTENSR